jgi:hypothetical protein
VPSFFITTFSLILGDSSLSTNVDRSPTVRMFVIFIRNYQFLLLVERMALHFAGFKTKPFNSRFLWDSVKPQIRAKFHAIFLCYLGECASSSRWSSYRNSLRSGLPRAQLLAPLCSQQCVVFRAIQILISLSSR